MSAQQRLLNCLAEIDRSSEHALDMAGSAIDDYWDHRLSFDPSILLDEIAGLVCDEKTLWKGFHHPGLPDFLNRLKSTTDKLRFLYSEYLPSLRDRFSSCFIVGSLSYARFYPTRFPAPEKQSDIDLFLVADERGFSPSDLVGAASIHDRIDDQRRLHKFVALLDRGTNDLINYKLFSAQIESGVSLTISTEAGMRNMLNMTDGERRVTTLHWNIHLGGRPIRRFDLARRAYQARYEEGLSDLGGTTLSLPVSTSEKYALTRLRRFNGFAEMLTPRFDWAFQSEEVRTMIFSFIRQIADMHQDFEDVGLSPNISNAHCRHERFSPYFRAKMDKHFQALIGQS
ncbi:hypothetical protein [Agrobacterium tumefaciens]|uniref:Uncharacterized protein n=1 Tax=Agrobacterium tumefaciens TaxID=358 RepID=A0AA44FAX7_AGRTU|nr:hypothetical protein [Agrobacterium tumefaciens]NTB87732.1 hypothetical protein [Agrobacterium tumefaciens]NTC32045.1 hypothetical protein [Agrobacterium tumefaciens]